MPAPITKKRKILFFIPFGITAINLLYSWITFMILSVTPFVQHYLGLLLFLPVIYFVITDVTFKAPIVLLGIYLLLAAISIASFIPYISTSSIGITIGGVKMMTPGLNGPALLLLILYGILNFDTLVDIYHDYKESKGKL